jgi:hypothetical protein
MGSSQKRQRPGSIMIAGTKSGTLEDAGTEPGTLEDAGTEDPTFCSGTLTPRRQSATWWESPSWWEARLRGPLTR